MKTIGVMGTGTMGSGIIQVCAAAGYDVVNKNFGIMIGGSATFDLTK